MTPTPIAPRSVGWVERSETDHFVENKQQSANFHPGRMGFAYAQPIIRFLFCIEVKGTLLILSFFIIGISMLIYPTRCYGAGALNLNKKDVVSDIKILTLHYGQNIETFCGIDSAPDSPKQRDIEFEEEYRKAVIIRADAGLPNGGDYDIYFAISGGKRPMTGVWLPTLDTYFLTARPPLGQSTESAVLYFNGLINGHCQTFVADANEVIDHESGASRTKIEIFRFVPDKIYTDGSQGAGPIFSLANSSTEINSSVAPSAAILSYLNLPIPK